MERRLNRLDQIVESLKRTGKARGLVGFGSVAEIDRLDAYSDLDFLVVAKRGYKRELVEDISWLTSVYPVGYMFKFTDDGYKVFYEDGILCDFGILEEEEVRKIPHGQGRIFWAEDVDESICSPTYEAQTPDCEVMIGNALTSLYVGLLRFARGERLAATREIQGVAVNYILLCSDLVAEEASSGDPFQVERRYERRYPLLAGYLPEMVQGYDRCPESALAILAFLEEYFEVNAFMKERIVALAHELMD